MKGKGICFHRLAMGKSICFWNKNIIEDINIDVEEERRLKIMDGMNTKIVKKRDRKSGEKLRKIHMYKDTAINAMKDSSDFDITIIESNGEYIEKLRLADSSEYDILKINMEKAETSEEREAIRKRMADMDKARYFKDAENKSFYEKQQEGHRNYNLKILGSVAIVSGLVYTFRKPIMGVGKKLISKR